MIDAGAILVIAAVLVVLLASALVITRARAAVRVEQVPFSDLLRDLDRGGVSEVVIVGDTLDVTLVGGGLVRTVAPPNYVTANPAFIPALANKHVRIDVRTASEQRAYGYGALVLTQFEHKYIR